MATATPLALAQHAPGQAECQAKARQLKATLDLNHKQREMQIATERNNEIKRCGTDTNCRNAASAKAVQLTLDNNEQFYKATSQAQAQLMQCNLVPQTPRRDETFSSNDPPAAGGPAAPGTSGRPAPQQGGVTDVLRTPPAKVTKPVERGGVDTPVPQSVPLRGGTTAGSAPGPGAAQGSTTLPAKPRQGGVGGGDGGGGSRPTPVPRLPGGVGTGDNTQPATPTRGNPALGAGVTAVVDLQERADCLPLPDEREQAQLRAESTDLLQTLANGGQMVDELQTKLGKLVAARLMRFTQPNPGLVTKVQTNAPAAIDAAGKAAVAYLTNDTTANHQALLGQLTRLMKAAEAALGSAARHPTDVLAAATEQLLLARMAGAVGPTCTATADRVQRLNAEIQKSRQAKDEMKRLAAAARASETPPFPVVCGSIGTANGTQTCVPATIAAILAKETGFPWKVGDFNWKQADLPWTPKEVRKMLRTQFGDRIFGQLSLTRNRRQSLGLYTLVTKQEFEKEMLRAGAGATAAVIYTKPIPGKPGLLEGHMVMAETRIAGMDYVHYTDTMDARGSGGRVHFGLPESFHIYRVSGSDRIR